MLAQRMGFEMSEPKMDKTSFSVVSLRDSDDVDYWLTKTPLAKPPSPK
jgi:hypothetical protein